MRSLTSTGRFRVGLACNETVRSRYIDDVDLARLDAVADFVFQPFAGDSTLAPPSGSEPRAEEELARFAAELDALVVCHGAPFVSGRLLERLPRLSMLGELEGDRFGYRIDVEAASGLGVRVVDTSHGSSRPTAEWALGLALVGLRNAGALFRRMVAGEPTYLPAELRWGQATSGRSSPGSASASSASGKWRANWSASCGHSRPS